MNRGGAAATDSGGTPVVLVVPPVIAPLVPTLGPAVLAPACVRGGIPTRVHYASLAFAERVGLDLCIRLASLPSPRTMLGEAIFWGAAFPEKAGRHRRLLETLLALPDPMSHLDPRRMPNRDEVMFCVDAIPAFLAETAERVLGASPRIVGVSAMGQQTLAGIAVAREIKLRSPETVTVLGGANAALPMGRAIRELTDAFDYVFSGEADLAFPEFCRAYLDRGELPADRVAECGTVADLDQVASPDYSDFFSALEPLRATDPLAADAPHWLLFESSRGCWWADRRKCAFCGFNAVGARFRRKSTERVVAEIDQLATRYGAHRLHAADNVMPLELPSTVLATLAERGSRPSLAYEVKSNLGERDLDLFVRAGVAEIQPGIESLSSPVLALMSKGVKALDNVRLLRDAHARGLCVVWNFLLGVPGETPSSYQAMLTLLPLIEHLPPPVRWGPLRISRFSPYHQDPARYGISGIRPWPGYVELFGEWAERIAHHFSGEYQTAFTRDPDLGARFDQALRVWANAWLRPGGPPELSLCRLDQGRALVHDHRACAVEEVHALSADMTAALESVRRPQGLAQIAPEHRDAIDRLAGAHLVALFEDEVLALPVEPALGESLRAQRRAAIESRAAHVVVGERS